MKALLIDDEISVLNDGELDWIQVTRLTKPASRRSVRYSAEWMACRPAMS